MKYSRKFIILYCKHFSVWLFEHPLNGLPLWVLSLLTLDYEFLYLHNLEHNGYWTLKNWSDVHSKSYLVFSLFLPKAFSTIWSEFEIILLTDQNVLYIIINTAKKTAWFSGGNIFKIEIEFLDRVWKNKDSQKL